MTDPTPELAAPATPKKTADDGTGYVVLEQEGPDETGWTLVGRVSARSAEAAIRAHAQKEEGSAGVFVAVPARSWQPARVTSKVTTALVIEGVDA